MVERHRDEFRRAAGLVEVAPQGDAGLGLIVLDAGLGPCIRDDDQLFQGRQAFEDFIELGALVDGFAGITVAGAGDQHLGLDLAEAVDDALGAEVWRGARPDRAEAGGGQHADQGLPGIGHARGDPVPPADTGRPQAVLQAGDVGGQFGVGQLFALAVLADRHHRRVIVAATQQVFGKIQARARKPLGAGHLGIFDQHCAGRAAKLHLEECHDRLPEIRALVDAPLVQGRVVAELHAVAIIDKTSEVVHPRGADTFRGGLPEDFGHQHGLLFLCRFSKL